MQSAGVQGKTEHGVRRPLLAELIERGGREDVPMVATWAPMGKTRREGHLKQRKWYYYKRIGNFRKKHIERLLKNKGECV